MQSQIIHFLKNAQGYISGEEISRHLKISRAGIWKHIQELRREGYEIVAVPHLGYQLVSSPDKLFPHEIQAGLKTQFLGNNIRHCDSIGSTMDEAFRLGVEGAEEGTVVCADRQTQGKGRLGRAWISPKNKGVYMSVILRPELSPADAARITLLGAVAVCEAIENFSSLPVRIKWPNDILMNGKKISGILTELSAEMDRVRFIVVGVGINVNASLSQLPSNATSIKNEMGKKFSRVGLVQEVLRSLEKWYGSLKQNGFDCSLKRWKELSSTLGQNVRVVNSNGDIEGEAIDLDSYGGLIIRNDSGLLVKKMTGDVVYHNDQLIKS